MVEGMEEAVIIMKDPPTVRLVKSKTSTTKKILPDFPHLQEIYMQNIVKEARSGATVHEGVKEGGGRPPLAPNRGERPRQYVFDRISNKGFVEEVKKRLRSKMKNQSAKILKQVGHIGNSSTASLIRDSESPFAESIQTCRFQTDSNS